MSLVLSLPLVKNFGETGKVEVGSLPFHNHGLGGSHGPNLSKISGVKSLFVSGRVSPTRTRKQFARGTLKENLLERYTLRLPSAKCLFCLQVQFWIHLL